jgi:hypothetical protein
MINSFNYTLAIAITMRIFGQQGTIDRDENLIEHLTLPSRNRRDDSNGWPARKKKIRFE